MTDTQANAHWMEHLKDTGQITDWKRSKNGNLWRKQFEKRHVVFANQAGEYVWAIYHADKPPLYSRGRWDTEAEAVADLLAYLKERR